jgi:hypothetical protein
MSSQDVLRGGHSPAPFLSKISERCLKILFIIQITRYNARICHNKSGFNLTAVTLNGTEETAIDIIMASENCPRSAIIRTQKLSPKIRATSRSTPGALRSAPTLPHYARQVSPSRYAGCSRSSAPKGTSSPLFPYPFFRPAPNGSPS